MKTEYCIRKTSFRGFRAALLCLPLLLASTAMLQAQRPSLGGLQTQINDLRSGVDSFFDISVDTSVNFGGGACSLFVDPLLPGLTESDPNGFRLLGPNGEGCRLTFGPPIPTDPFPCVIEVLPPLPGNPKGLLLRDPCLRVLPRNPVDPPRLFFGPTDDCSLGVFPGLPGLTETDPIGFRLLGPGNEGCRLIFGPTMDCTVEIQPGGPSGLLLRDPSGIRILPPQGAPQGASPRLIFGPTDDCSLGIVPGLRGLSEMDPQGFRLLGQNLQGCELLFGPTDLCRIFIDPVIPKMFFSDPNGFCFQGPLGTTTELIVNGPVSAQAFIQTSSRDLKENIRPLENSLDTIEKLRGVSFDWKKEKGGQPAVGFIADEVAEVLPELTAFDENGKPSGVQYANMVALVVEGVKDQQEQIEALQAENAALKKDLNTLRESKDDQLRNELDSLKKQMAELAKGMKTGNTNKEL